MNGQAHAAVLAWQQTVHAAWQQLGPLVGPPPERGTEVDDHVRDDWAGREILDRYLGGGGDWRIVDDPKWSEYMMSNRLLSDQLYGRIRTEAQNALRQFLWTGVPGGQFDNRFHAEIDNGEGVVGYQYLHGTNADEGDFQFSGDTQVQPLPDGTYEVTIDGGYTWNDRIDPNSAYWTDRVKNGFAEVITFGRADPYDLRITWHARTTATLDENGTVVALDGYPADHRAR